MDRINLLTNRNPKTKIISSEYGDISYQQWCKLEESRTGKARVDYKHDDTHCWLERKALIG